jgi:D-alanine-D-alanine ligase
MRIAVLANLKENAPRWEGMPPDQWDDLDSPKTTNGIIAALESAGHEACYFEANILPPHNLIERLREYRPDLCFNIAEGHRGDSRESQIPAVLEMMGIPYTGSKLLTLTLALDKPMTKRVLHYHGLPTPEFQVFENADEPIDQDLLDDATGDLRFPLFVKPSREGTSVGVSAQSIVSTVDQLRVQLDKQIKRYNQTILAEHYVKGRELTLGMVGNLGPRYSRHLNERVQDTELPDTLTFFPILEVDMEKYGDSEAGLYTNRIKVEMVDAFHYACPAHVDEDKAHELRLLAAAVFRVTGCKDVARVDFRLDQENDDKPYILEVNPLPGLNPGYSDLCLEALAGGWSHAKLVNTIVDLACERQRISAQRGMVGECRLGC